MDSPLEENAGAGGWGSSADSPVGQLSAESEAVRSTSDALKKSTSVADGAEHSLAAMSAEECSSVMSEEAVLVSRIESELSKENALGSTGLSNESRTAKGAENVVFQSAQTFKQFQSQQPSSDSSFQTTFEESAAKQLNIQGSLETSNSRTTIDTNSNRRVDFAVKTPIEKQVRKEVMGQVGRGSGDNLWLKAANEREYKGTASELQQMLARCRQELAQEKATCESLRYYYGCGASERTEAKGSLAGKELKQKVAAFRNHDEKLLMEVKELKEQTTLETKRASELTERVLESANRGSDSTGKTDELQKTKQTNGVEGSEAQEKKMELQTGGVQRQTAEQQSEIELLRIQIGALKAIVSIQEDEVLRKSQLKLTGKEEKSLQEAGQQTESESSNTNSSKNHESGRAHERQERNKDGSKTEKSWKENELKGANYVKQVLSRWRKEVYALVLECKQREWEAVQESEKQKKQLEDERVMCGELDGRCKVLELKVVSLGAELQLYKAAAQQSQEALSRLQKEHKHVTSARDQAETALQTVASSVREWHLKEGAQIERLAESEKKLRGFVKRLSFAESRVAVGRQLGRARKAASQVEAKQLEDKENRDGKMKRLSDANETGWRGCESSLRESSEKRRLQKGQESNESNAERELSGSTKCGREKQSFNETVNEKDSQEGKHKQVTSSVTESRSEREVIRQVEKRVVGAFVTLDKECEAEIVRLQKERAMLVHRVDQLEGGFVLASLTTKLAKVEATLGASMERAKNAETRAANLEELLASARSSLAVEGEAVRQLQTQLHDLEVSSKKALSRQLRQTEEQARADFEAAKEVHEKTTSALQSKVSALERENAKLLVNLRQLERQAAQTRERKQIDRDLRVSELESRLEQRDADLKSVRKERSVLLAQLRKVQKEAHLQLEKEEKQYTQLEREGNLQKEGHVQLERKQKLHMQLERKQNLQEEALVQLEREEKKHLQLERKHNLQKKAHMQVEKEGTKHLQLETEQKRHGQLERGEKGDVQLQREQGQHVQLERQEKQNEQLRMGGKLHSRDKGLHAEVVVTPAPGKESNTRQPLFDTPSALRNGVALDARRERLNEAGEGESIFERGATLQMSNTFQVQHIGQNDRKNGMIEPISGDEEGTSKLLPSFGMRPLEGADSSQVEEALFLGSLETSDSEHGSRPEILPEIGLYAFRELSQRRRVSEVIDDSNNDLITRLNKLAQLSSAILEDPTLI